MDVVALAVACLSLLVSGLALGWQVASWLLDAGRVRVVLRHGLLAQRAAITSLVGADGKASDLESVRAQGYDGPEVLAIAVTNVGRAPVTVTKYGAKLIGAAEFSPIADHLGPALPFRLEPGTTESWLVDMDSVRALVHAGQVLKEGARDVAMFAELGTGKTVVTRRTIRNF